MTGDSSGVETWFLLWGRRLENLSPHFLLSLCFASGWGSGDSVPGSLGITTRLHTFILTLRVHHHVLKSRTHLGTMGWRAEWTVPCACICATSWCHPSPWWKRWSPRSVSRSLHLPEQRDWSQHFGIFFPVPDLNIKCINNVSCICMPENSICFSCVGFTQTWFGVQKCTKFALHGNFFLVSLSSLQHNQRLFSKKSKNFQKLTTFVSWTTGVRPSWSEYG